MTQEEKQLLLKKDLCMRLPYGVIVQYKGHNTIIKNKILTGSDLDCNIEYYKPYLRPISSMTDEERKKLNVIIVFNYSTLIRIKNTPSIIDYLNSIHIDYRGLIPKGLAIEVTEENNPYKD